MIQKIILQSPTYYYYQSLPTKCMFDLFERDYESAIENARRATEIRSAHQMGQQQLLLEPFIGIL